MYVLQYIHTYKFYMYMYNIQHTYIYNIYMLFERTPKGESLIQPCPSLKNKKYCNEQFVHVQNTPNERPNTVLHVHVIHSQQSPIL